MLCAKEDWTIRRNCMGDRDFLEFKIGFGWISYISHHPWITYTIPLLESTRSRCISAMGLLPDTENCGVVHAPGIPGMFSHHWLQKIPLISDPGIHHDKGVTHVQLCMSGSLSRGGGDNVPGIAGACATRNFTYLARGPWYTTQLEFIFPGTICIYI